MRSLSNKTKGIICILAAAFGFALMTAFVRAAGDVPVMQKSFFRNLVAMFIASIALIRSDIGFKIEKSYRLDIFFRCLFGTSGVIANFYAIGKLGIADANMLNKLAPFFAIILSIPLLKEVPSKIDAISTLIAFVGALFIIRPTGIVSEMFPALVAFYGGFGAGTAYVFVRRASKKGAETPTIVFAFSTFSCLVTLPFIVFDYHPMTKWQLISLLMAGVSASLGQFSITSAYRFAPAKDLSVFDYTQVIFAALIGIVAFSETPVLLSILGYVIIIGVSVVRWLKRNEEK